MAPGKQRTKKAPVFNKLKRPKLLRKRIPASEATVGVLVLLAIVGMSVWLWAQRTNYDPGERDISMEILVEQSVADNLYKIPLKRWRDPELGPTDAIAVDLGPLDPALLTGGWRSASSPQVFDDDTLYEKINGQAEQYRKFGFEKLMVLELEHPGEGRSIDVYLYDQGSFEGSLGVFEEQRGEKPVVERGSVRYTPSALGAIGMNGRTFFHIIGNAPDPAIEAMTRRLVESLARLPGAEPPPVGFTMLNKGLEIPFHRIAYQPRNVFQYGFARRFWFARVGDTGKEDAGDARLFVHFAESPAAARDLFERLRTELLEDYEGVAGETTSVGNSQGAGRALLRHKFLATYFGLAHDGARVFGVEKHPRRVDAVTVLGTLQACVAGESEDGYHDDGEEGDQ